MKTAAQLSQCHETDSRQQQGLFHVRQPMYLQDRAPLRFQVAGVALPMLSNRLMVRGRTTMPEGSTHCCPTCGSPLEPADGKSGSKRQCPNRTANAWGLNDALTDWAMR